MIYIGVTGSLGALMCGCTYFFDFKEKRSKGKSKKIRRSATRNIEN